MHLTKERDLFRLIDWNGESCITYVKHVCPEMLKNRKLIGHPFYNLTTIIRLHQTFFPDALSLLTFCLLDVWRVLHINPFIKYWID